MVFGDGLLANSMFCICTFRIIPCLYYEIMPVDVTKIALRPRPEAMYLPAPPPGPQAKKGHLRKACLCLSLTVIGRRQVKRRTVKVQWTMRCSVPSARSCMILSSSQCFPTKVLKFLKFAQTPPWNASYNEKRGLEQQKRPQHHVKKGLVFTVSRRSTITFLRLPI